MEQTEHAENDIDLAEIFDGYWYIPMVTGLLLVISIVYPLVSIVELYIVGSDPLSFAIGTGILTSLSIFVISGIFLLLTVIIFPVQVEKVNNCPQIDWNPTHWYYTSYIIPFAPLFSIIIYSYRFAKYVLPHKT